MKKISSDRIEWSIEEGAWRIVIAIFLTFTLILTITSFILAVSIREKLDSFEVKEICEGSWKEEKRYDCFSEFNICGPWGSRVGPFRNVTLEECPEIGIPGWACSRERNIEKVYTKKYCDGNLIKALVQKETL